MPGSPLSLDVEQVSCTLMDVFDVLTRETMYTSTPDLDKNATGAMLTGTSNSPAALCRGMD